MKPLILIAIILFSFAWSAKGQSDAHLVLKGNVNDTVQGIPIPNLEFEVQINSINKIIISSDSLGNFQLETNLTRGTNTIYFKSANRNYTIDYAFEFQAQNDTTLHKTIQLLPSRLCWDSFLNDPLYFSKNQFELPKDSLQEMIQLISVNSTEFTEIFQKRLIKVRVYCSYDEKQSIGKKRAKWIKGELEKSGLNINDFNIVVEAKNPLFICDYCDGCHYFYLKGKGHTLSEDQYNLLQDENAKDAHLANRRVITFMWEEKLSE